MTKKKLRQVDYTGWDGNAFKLNAMDDKDAKGIYRWSREEIGELYIDIAYKNYVSAPCWIALMDQCSRWERKSLAIRGFTYKQYYETIVGYSFYFDDDEVGKVMFFKVQASARNKRSALKREIQKVEAGGHYNKAVLEQLFIIQEGLCYYSGEKLEKSPKNYDLDHILSLYNGGGEWPENLALCLKPINQRKGGDMFAEYFIGMKSNGKRMGFRQVEKQQAFCEMVDEKRVQLDREYREGLWG
ncbi:MAG: hypothetical protein ACJAS1_003690 [Oleiphilaceae bacterium]|jgi:hypothetical protein